MVEGSWQRAQSIDPNSEFPRSQSDEASAGLARTRLILMDVPQWIPLVSDPSRHGHRASLGVLGCQAPGHWHQILWYPWLARWGLYGWYLAWHATRMLSWIGIWGSWRLGQNVGLIITILRLFLSSFSSVSGLCVLLEGPLPSRSAVAMVAVSAVNRGFRVGEGDRRCYPLHFCLSFQCWSMYLFSDSI